MQSLTVAEQQKEKNWGAETKEKSFSAGILKGSREGFLRRQSEGAIRSWWVAFTDLLAPCVLTSTGQPLDYEEDLEKTTSCSMSSEWRLVPSLWTSPSPHSHVPNPSTVIPAPTSEAGPGWNSVPPGYQASACTQGCSCEDPAASSVEELTWIRLPHSTVKFHNLEQTVKISKDDSVSAEFSEIWLNFASRFKVIQEGWKRVGRTEGTMTYDSFLESPTHPPLLH